MEELHELESLLVRYPHEPRLLELKKQLESVKVSLLEANPEYGDFLYWRAPLPDIDFELPSLDLVHERIQTLSRRVETLKRPVEPAVPKPKLVTQDSTIRDGDDSIFVPFGDGWVSLDFLKTKMQEQAPEVRSSTPVPAAKQPETPSLSPVSPNVPSTLSSSAVPATSLSAVPSTVSSSVVQQTTVTQHVTNVNVTHIHHNVIQAPPQQRQPVQNTQFVQNQSFQQRSIRIVEDVIQKREQSPERPMHVNIQVNHRPDVKVTPPRPSFALSTQALHQVSSARNSVVGLSPRPLATVDMMPPAPMDLSAPHQPRSSAVSVRVPQRRVSETFDPPYVHQQIERPSASQTTLNPESIESILGETNNGSLKLSSQDDNQARRKRIWNRLFRYLHLVRSIIVCGFGINAALKALKSDPVFKLGASPVFVANIVFLCFETGIAFFEATTTIWALVADHDLLTDIVPLVLNVGLQIYSYLGERLSFLEWSKPMYQNYVLLVLYGVTLAYTILFHALRRWALLVFSKKAPTLATFFVIKCLLLIMDLVTQGLLLYSVLVYYGLQLFGDAVALRLAISIVFLSPMVTLATNSLVNFPIHFYFMKLKLVMNGFFESVSWHRLFKSASQKTFQHPFVVFNGILSIYVFASTFWILSTINGTTLDSFSQVSTFLQIDSKTMITRLVQVNILANYGFGILSTIVFWVYTLLTLLF
ncbi:hypothetical protein EDD86DRAFT_248312 [Gorgonomyces haynaldii]|nr:hypothetical protein EDD86DRAFT_248312 [Gorgonomyces haynaldii]